MDFANALDMPETYITHPRFMAPVVIAIVIATLIYFGSMLLGIATMVVIGGSAIIAYFVWLNMACDRIARSRESTEAPFVAGAANL